VNRSPKPKSTPRSNASAKRAAMGGDLFQQAFHSSPAMQSIVSVPESVIVQVNEAFTKHLGYERAHVIGKNPMDLKLWVSPEKLAAYRALLQSVGSVRNFEADVRRADGAIRTVLMSSDRVAIDGATFYLNAAVDITDRKRAEAELQHALEKERELGQLKSDFVSLVSHEFRTPLEVIMSSAENLERYHERLPAEKRQQLLRTITKSVRRMDSMMEEVLMLGKLQSDRIAFSPSRFELGPFCRRICDEIESATAKRCPIQLRVTDLTDWAFGDESVLRHIFTNLLSNAVKYSPADQLIDFDVQREKEICVFRITDRGCGIPQADQKKLFHAFHRGGNVGQVPGTGLGLFIVRRSVDLHGGEIAFESRAGKGTAFTVRLPLFQSVKSKRTRKVGVASATTDGGEA
jgi:PAS domain S-box-containing protein